MALRRVGAMTGAVTIRCCVAGGYPADEHSPLLVRVQKRHEFPGKVTQAVQLATHRLLAPVQQRFDH